MKALVSNNRQGPIVFFAIVVLATTFSIAATGFKFGINNNIFHIPYVLGHENLGQFQHDAFYQSLSKFTTPVWPLLRMFSNDGNIESVFLISHIVSRGLAFLALLWFFRANQVRNAGAAMLGLLAIAVCPWLMNVSEVGKHGMFLQYFTHSELTWGPLFAALVAAQLGRFGMAALFAGIVFVINAFIGTWLASILACVIAANPAYRKDWKLVARSAGIFLLVCAPVLTWIAAALHGKGPVQQFSYIDYIRSYFPAHFLIEVATFDSLRNLALIALCGFVSAFLSRDRRFWSSVLVGCVLLLVAGAVLPYLLNNRFLFNLHLLRADGVLEFIALALSVCVALRVVFDAGAKPGKRAVAFLALVALASPGGNWLSLVITALCLGWLALEIPLHWNAVAITMGVLAMGAEYQAAGLSSTFLLRWPIVSAAIGVLLFAKRPAIAAWTSALSMGALLTLAMLTMFNWRIASVSNAASKNRITTEMTDWVRQSRLQGPFLFPNDSAHRGLFGDFQLLTRKPVWVEWKQGAAVMWDPGFYWQWAPRNREVDALHSAQQLAGYAVQKHVPYLVLPADLGACPALSEVLYRNRGFSVCAIAPAGSPNAR